jgi:NADPH-dependent 2,4-dienoyl-CoA reductase/sulfur reductase-like enzyme
MDGGEWPQHGEPFEVLVVGAGPAGLAAACAAAEAGRRVAVVDDNAAAGGQIWRGAGGRAADPIAAKWLARFRRAGGLRFWGTAVVAAPEPGLLTVDGPHGAIDLRYERMILATGARERFLPFPGWTSPRVMGAGGLQAMVKSGMPIAGKTVVVAGSGPLLLAVAATLRKLGARVPLIAEQAAWGRVAGFGVQLARDAGKLRQAVALKLGLRGVAYRTGCWPMRVEERGSSARVRLNRGGEVECDYLACGFFLVPDRELPALLGCEAGEVGVSVDAWQRTSRPEIYAAGEVTGTGGLEKSLIEGEIAGLAAAGREEAARRLFGPRERAYRFAGALRRAFELRPELKGLAGEETIVCRCEDVRYGRLRGFENARDAKLQTRCGMGPCQGRVCGAACEFLFGWRDASVRPPILPVAVGHLSSRPSGQPGVSMIEDSAR